MEKNIETGASKTLYEKQLKEYTEKFGPDNAQYLMETEQNWKGQYNWTFYIDWSLPKSDEYKVFTRQCADYLGWQFKSIKGDPALFQNLCYGLWPEKDFLVLKAGRKIAQDKKNMCDILS